MLRKVYLEGEIADKFGSEFDMDVSNFGEAIQCFETNFNNFRNYLIECQEKGIGFVCSVEGKPIEEDHEMLFNYPEGSFTLQAVPTGSKRALGKIIVAAILIAVSIKYPGLGKTLMVTAAGTEIGIVSAAIFLTGLNFAMAGVQQLMAPDPSVDLDNQQDNSYLFQGAGQSIIEGEPVPILYGKLRIPGRPISFEIKNENRSFTDYIQPGLDFVVPDDSGGNSSNGGSDQPSEDHGPTQKFKEK